MDAVRNPVSGAGLTISGTATDQSAIAPVRSAGVGPVSHHSPAKEPQQLEIKVEHSDYATEILKLRRDATGAWLWDNAACLVLRTATRTRIDILLGRMWMAPTKLLRDDELEKATVPNPNGVLLRRHGADTPGKKPRLAYRKMVTAGVAAFRRLNHPVKGDENGQEWSRFSSVTADVRPQRDGRLYWVEYGSPPVSKAGQPRFLIALWVPFYAKPVSKLDIVVFFTPSTAHRVEGTNKPAYPPDSPPYRGEYPYGLRRDPGDEQWWQPYTELAHRYLYNRFHLVHQLLAARRRAVIVVPIVPALKATQKAPDGGSDWSAFDTPARLGRVLDETCLFIHRELLDVAPVHRNIDQQGALAGASVRDRPQVWRRHASPPRVGRVVVSGFSAAYLPIAKLIRHKASDSDALGLPGKHYASDADAFRSSWKEIWDLDLAKLSKDIVIDMARWSTQDTDRQLRLYHSAHTRKDRAVGDPLADTSLARGRKVKTHTASNDEKVFIHESHEDPSTASRWSSVGLSNEYLDADSANHDDDAVPEFRANDPHSFMPKIFFGHAAHTSNLERWPS